MNEILFGIGMTAMTLGFTGLIIMWVRFCVDHIESDGVIMAVAVFFSVVLVLIALFAWVVPR